MSVEQLISPWSPEWKDVKASGVDEINDNLYHAAELIRAARYQTNLPPRAVELLYKRALGRLADVNCAVKAKGLIVCGVYHVAGFAIMVPTANCHLIYFDGAEYKPYPTAGV